MKKRFRVPRILPASVLLCTAMIGGCRHEMHGDAKVVGPAAEPAAASAAELARGTLQQRLAAVEEKIDATLASGADDAERRALARQRLVLTIAMGEIGRRIEGGDTGPVDVDRLLTSVELMLSRRSSPRPRRPGAKTGKKDKVSKRRPLKPLEEKKKESAKDKPDDGRARAATGKLSGDRGQGGDGDLDSLAAEGDGIGDAETGEDEAGRVEKARVEDESLPSGFMTAVHQRLGALEACLGDVDADLKLEVTVRLSAAGAVRLAKVHGIAGREATCISRVLKRVRVPDHDGGTRIVRFPLYFTP